MPTGSENPSAAFLAGQQHGAKLAVQHRTRPVGIVKSKHDATGITDYGVNPNAKPGASPKRKTAAAPTTLLDQAKALAAADTQAQIDAIRAQQDVYTKQASDRAGQVNLAAQAAAKYLTGIGDATAGSYTDAAKTLAGFASGYSGDLRATAEGAAAQQQQALAGLGAPAEGLKTPTGPVGSPTSLANVLYGLGGVIPSTLLVTAGQAQAGAQRQLPAATLGYGQQEALGVLGAGAKQADTLTPDLLAAQGKLPALTQQYLSALQDREHQLFGEKLDLAKYQTGIDQWTAEQKLALAKYGTSIDQFNTRTKLSVQRLNLEAQRIANQAYQSDRSYGIQLANLGISQKRLQIDALKDEAKLKNGGYTPAQIIKYQGLGATIADNAFTGIPKFDKVGNIVTRPDGSTVWAHPPVNYKQALREARKEGIPVSIATEELNKVYKPGVRGRPLKDTGSASFDFSAYTQLTNPWSGPAGKVSLAPGADRSGVSTNPAVKSFVGQVASIAGEPLTITTGTAHNKDVFENGADTGRESDHWTGNAADIFTGNGYGPEKLNPHLVKIGQAALVAAGADPAWARQQTGGAFSFNTAQGRVQVIFNSYTGGNHYNHLHVGVRPGG